MARLRIGWAERIRRAQVKGKFTYVDHMYAGEWTSCAIGEKHDWQDTSPHDNAELDLGVQFAGYVCNNDVKAAAQCYAQILALP